MRMPIEELVDQVAARTCTSGLARSSTLTRSLMGIGTLKKIRRTEDWCSPMPQRSRRVRVFTSTKV
jgi:hypothetical protein